MASEGLVKLQLDSVGVIETMMEREVFYYPADVANRMVDELRERCGALERGLKAVQGNCKWRDHGLCDLDCPGRSFCDVTGLNAMYLRREEDVCAG